MIARSLGLVLVAGAALAAPPDPVVYIEVAKGYQGLLWDGGPAPGVMPGTGTGSGFVIDPAEALAGLPAAGDCRPFAADRLWIVTNEHVARHPTEMTVTIMWEEQPGAPRQFNVPCELVAQDQRVDLALLAVDAADLRAAGLDPATVPRMTLWDAEPSSLAQGEAVQALGNPQGLKRVMTTGVVSAPLQQLGWDHPFAPGSRIVQTDAAINGGNSGGPLVLASTGQVVAVNFAGGGQNLNFAIPARRVRLLLAQVACGRGIRHGKLPFEHEEVDGRIQAALDLPDIAGEVVLDPRDARGRPVEGLEPLDVIVAVSGRLQPEAGGGETQVRIGPGGTPLVEAVFDLEPGSDAKLLVWRDGAKKEVVVRVASADLQGAGADDVIELLGAHLERLADWKRAVTRHDGEGLVCGHVEPGSPAAQAGLQKNDVVTRVLLREGDAVRSVEVTDVASLREALPALVGAFEAARSAGRPVVLGFVADNLDSRGSVIRLLRTPPRSPHGIEPGAAIPEKSGVDEGR